VADLAFENDVEALMMVRRMFNYLPAEQPRRCRRCAGRRSGERLDYSLNTLVPDNPNKPYDIKELIRKTSTTTTSSRSSGQRQEHRGRLRPQ